MNRFYQLRSASILALGLYLIAPGYSTQAQQAPSPERPTRLEEVTLVEARAGDVVVAKTNIKAITVQDLIDFGAEFNIPFEPKAPPDRIAQMPDWWLSMLAEQYAFALAAEKKADAVTDPIQVEAIHNEFDSYLLNLVLPELNRRAVEDKIVQPTDDDLRAYMEKHKPEYYEPFQFWMRHIFLMTFESYQTREGDTLESIAANIAGDPKAIAEIRADVPGRPYRWVAPEDRENQLFKPLAVGENLLVPMRPERRQTVKERVESIRKELIEGKTFRELAENHSDAEIKGDKSGPFPTGLRPMSPEILEMAQKLEINEISPVFHTRNGYYVIQVTEKEGTGFKKFEDVREEIRASMLSAQRSKLGVDTLKALFALDDVKIHFEEIEKAPELAADALVVEIGDKKIRWEEFESHWQKYIGENADREIITRAIQLYPPANLKLALVWARENGLLDEPEFKRRRDALRTAIVAQFYFRTVIKHEVATMVTDQAIEQYYRENLSRLFTEPERISYQVIERQLDAGIDPNDNTQIQTGYGKIIAALTEELKQVITIEEFIALARRTNPPATLPDYPPMAGYYVPTYSIGGETGEQLTMLETGEWTEQPYYEDQVIRVAAVTMRAPSRVKPIDEVQSQIESRARRQTEEQLRAKYFDQWLQEAQYEFTLKEASAPRG